MSRKIVSFEPATNLPVWSRRFICTATLFNTGDWSDLVQMSHDEYKEIHQALTEKDVKKAGDLRRKWLGFHLDRIKLKF